MPKFKVVQEWRYTVEFDEIESADESEACDKADNDPHIVCSRITCGDLINTKVTETKEA